jgi:uncharacterized repeat protein (TIGR01451 family)
MVPLLILTFALILSFTINDVAATNAASNTVIVPTHNVTVNNTVQAVNSQTNIQNKSKTNKSKTSNTSNSINTKKQQSLPDPQIYNGGAPVARGGNPVGFVYSSIAAAITVAHSGDTIMLENGATFQEHGLVINKNLNFNVFNNGFATIDAKNLGNIFLISNGVTVILKNLILKNGKSTLGGAIYNNGTLTVNNCAFQDNSATKNGGAIYNDGTLTYDAVTHTSETVTKNGGTLTVINSSFTGNKALNGGAIYNAGTLNITTSATLTDFTITQNGGTLSVINSVFKNNSATQNGGAIANDATFNVVGFSTLTRDVITRNGGTTTISDSTFMGNKANNGGAISNLATLNTAQSTLTGTATTGTTALNSGTVSVKNSAIIGNTANIDGGAIYNGARTSVTSTTLTDYTINNDATIDATFNTMAGNSALNGGAIFNDAVSTVTTNTLTRTTLNNAAAATTTDNALVGNHATTGRDIVNNQVLTQNNNVITVSFMNNTGTVDAMRNWWGFVTGPAPGDVVGTVDTSNFLIYTMNIAATASNSSPKVGQQFHYTITVTNNGPDAATDVQITDGIPAGLTFNGATASQGSYNHSTEVWNVQTLASGASATLELFVTPTANLADTTVTKNVTLLNTNDTVSAIVSVPEAVNVVLNSTTSNSSPSVGEEFNYTVTATNNGPNTATGVQVKDVIPAGLTFNGYSATQGTYDSTTGIWNVGTLVNGSSATLVLFVTPTSSVAGTTVTNIATLTAVNQLNLLTSPFTTVSINIPGNSVINNSTSNLNAETNKIPLQHTGVPIAGFILAILMIVSGSIIPKLKK